jgi:hypothetical protein
LVLLERVSVEELWITPNCFRVYVGKQLRDLENNLNKGGLRGRVWEGEDVSRVDNC